MHYTIDELDRPSSVTRVWEQTRGYCGRKAEDEEGMGERDALLIDPEKVRVTIQKSRITCRWCKSKITAASKNPNPRHPDRRVRNDLHGS